MDPELFGTVIGSVLTGVAGVITAITVGVVKVLSYIRERDRFFEAREAILFERLKLVEDRLVRVTGEANVTPDPLFEYQLVSLEHRYRNLVERGKAP